jgi:hypothetical protein
MKSKVLITHSYFLYLDPKQWKQAQPYAPLGTLVAAAVVREAGFPISFYDSMFAVDNSAFKIELQNKRPNILVIYDDGFNYLTKMCLTNMRDACFEMIKIAKQFNLTNEIAAEEIDKIKNRIGPIQKNTKKSH